MPQASRTFRIFVSSTFSDLKEERNALQERVFPRLRDLAMAHGCRFQAIDLRWGVSEEAALDQQTMKICLGEIERCQKTSPKPNFIVLLGNRYGWRPLPAEIPADEFERIIPQVSKEDRSLLEQWYRRDDNAVPAVYCLQPRSGEYVEYDSWEKVEDKLRQIFLAAIEWLPLLPDEAIKYTASATEQEIVHGALRVPDAQEHVFCYFREIEGLPADERGEGFNDLNAKAARKQEELKARLRQQLPGNIHSYNARWQEGPSLDHLDRLCEDVYADLSKVMLAEISHLESVDPLDKEIAANDDFGTERARVFIGRAELLKSIADYIKWNDPHPLAVWGVSGSGKSALMARAVQQVRESGKDVIVRFIGATPESSNGRALLASLCRQISQRYGADETNIPLEYKDLVGEFPKRLALATPDKPLALFLDALDQLSNADNARNLIWLPADLPANVRLILSTLPGECLSALERKLPASNRHQLEPLSREQGSEALELWQTDARRTLQPEQRAAVLNKFTQNGLPLYLNLAFEQARLWRSYDGVRELGADIPESIGNLFERLSNKANHGEVMVSHSLGYLAAGKNGLTEDELLQVLSRDLDVYQWFVQSVQHIPPDLLTLALSFHTHKDPALCTVQEREDTTHWLQQIIKHDPPALVEFLQFAMRASSPTQLPVLLWSRLYFDLEPYLTERSADGTALLTFYHRQLNEFATTHHLNPVFHQRLAAYFAHQSLYAGEDGTGVPNLRRLSEQPYQEAHGGLSDELRATLTEFNFLEAKVSAQGVQPLIDDYDLIGIPGLEIPAASQRNLRLVQGALRLSANVLASDKSQLAPQLTGRLLSLKEPEIKTLLERTKETKKDPWLRPLALCFTPPGGYLVRTLVGHTSLVTAVAVTPDGNRAISAAKDKTLKVWDLEHGTELATLQGDWNWEWPHSVAVTDDGRRAISDTGGHKLKVWDLERGTVLVTLKHMGTVSAVAVTPDGKRAVSGSMGHTLKVWDLERGSELATLQGHTSGVYAVAMTPDGTRAVSGSEDGTFKVWDLERGSELATLQGHT
ncbi:MAG: DUF4062 domain-containing protein, partial [Chloroflexota bacterium]|nr:DUF4062 domain-containing protein [Chloroflexota bacterium]